MNNSFENIIPWNGANDTGRDVRLKWERNFAKIGLNFAELAGKFTTVDEMFDLIAEELANRLRKDQEDVAAKHISFEEGITVKTPSDSVTNRKSIAPAIIEEGELTEFLSRNITEVSDDYDAESQAISLGAVEVSSGGSGAATVGELDNVDESFDTCPDGIYSWQKKGQVFFPIKGTTGGGSSKMALSFISPSSLVVVYGGDAVIRYGFTSILDDEPTGAGTATYTVNNKIVYSATVKQGEISFHAGKYLLQGENALVISVTDTYGNVRRLTYNINAANISLTSTFDNSRVYSGGISFAYTPVGAVEKVVHFILDGREIGTVTTTSSNRQQSYAIPSQTHGAHSLEVYMTATIDGTPIESNHLFYEFISIKEGNNTPVIASSFCETDTEQFSTIVVPYMVYNPAAIMADITLSANGNIVSTQSVNRTPQTWSYRTVDSGALALKIACGSVSRTFNLTVSESAIDVSAETADLMLFLTSINRSNNEEGRNIWNYQEIYALLTAFNWATNGWIKTIEGFIALRINGDARVTIPYNSFAGDFRATGKTLEFEFETRDVTDYDKVILSCMNGGIGLQVTAQSAVFKSRQTTITTQFKEDERVRISFVVEKRVENRLIYVYINGEMCGVVQYPEQDDFTQSNPVGISIGSDVCTTDIFNIRVYDNNLNRYQLLDNYLADMDNLEVKKGLFADNNIYDDYGNVSYTKVVDKVPALTIIGRLPAYKGDKVTCRMAYEDKQNPNRSWTCNSVQNDVQGTSSQYYPRKNYKFKFKSSLTMQDGSTADKFAVREGEIPVNCFCTKADFAEASGCHNTGMARMVDFVLRGLGQLTPPQKTDIRVRTTIDGYPIVIFHKETEDSEPTFLGKYNFNNDKSTQETFGFTSGCECWEILNNTSDRVLFKTSDYTTEEWKKDFEARYPEDYTDNTKLKRLTDWLVSVKGNPTKFKQEAPKYLDIPFILSYYILTEFFAMVDQRAKNMFLTTFDGTHWFSVFYDNDTCLGINNEGVNAFDFTVEYHDKLGTQDVWNGEQSTLWNNVEQAYATEISTMYAEMRKNGLLTYEQCDYYLNQEQCDKWSASIYNEDGWFKYVTPLLEEDNGSYLYAAQGSRKMHRIWWLHNRFKYMDSRYIAGDYMNDFATMRLYTPTSWEGVEPNANITLTSYVGQYINVKYGSYIVGSHAKKNVPVTIQAPDIRFNDTETIIYGASQISSLGDLSALYAGTVDVSKMDKLTELIVGSGVSEYKNTNLTVLSVGANNLLRKLDVRNCPNLTQAIDVSKCGGIREIWAEGTGITGISLPEGGNLTLLRLPDTITSLTLRNQAHLEDSGLWLAGVNNLKTIRWENCLADALPVIARCLSIEPRQLERLRVLGADWNMPTLDILNTLSQMGGLDENGNNVPKAVITGKLHVDIAESYELGALNDKFPFLTITYDKLVTTPLRIFTITRASNSTPFDSIDVIINGETHVTNEEGIVQVRSGATLNVTVEQDGYKTHTQSYPSISAAVTNYSIKLDNYVNVTFTVKNTEGGIMQGIVITMDGKTATTNAMGMATISTTAGNRLVSYDYNGRKFTETITVGYVNINHNYNGIIVPTRTVIVRSAASSSSRFAGIEVKVGYDYYTTDSNGSFIVRDSSQVSATVAETDSYKGITVTLPSFTTATKTDYIDVIPYVTASITVVGKNGFGINGASVTLQGKSATTGGGVARLTKLSYQTSVQLKVTYESEVHTENVNIGYTDFSKTITLNVDEIESMKPVPNGNPQMMVTTSRVKEMRMLVSGFLPGQNAQIDWGDGSPLQLINSNTMNHTYVDVGLFNIEIKNATNLTLANVGGVSSSGVDARELVAYWTIGNTNIQNVLTFNSTLGYSYSEKKSLSYVGDDVFKNDSNRTDWSYIFFYSKISNIPTSFVQNNKKAKSFTYCFAYCSSLTTIPSGLFDSCIAVTTFQFCFQSCTSLTTIPSGLFDSCIAVTTFQFCFQSCTSLTTIPQGLFDNCTAVTDFVGFFSYCSSLVYCEIPQFKIDSNKNYYLNRATLLSYLKSNSTTPPTITGSTIPNNTNLKIYVPDASVDAYKTATNWSAYASKIYPLSEYED